MFGVCRSEGSAELSTNFLPKELTLASRSRNRVGDPSSRSRASRSSSGRAAAFSVYASPVGLESPKPDGEVRAREVPRETLEALREEFRERFGRDPGPDDPVFFDPTAEEPRSLDEDVEALFIAMSEMAMRRAGIDPSLIYASRKTGLIVTERNQHLLSGDDRADWIEAIFEYEGEAIRHHLQEAHGREYVAAAKEAGRIYAETAERICPHCGQHLEYPESAWD
jgi:hypothetical protein